MLVTHWDTFSTTVPDSAPCSPAQQQRLGDRKQTHFDNDKISFYMNLI